MNQIYKMISDRLENKKAELKEKQKQFLIMFREDEMQSSTFERNTINDLLIMQQLKSEIAELERWEMLLRTQMNK